MSTPSRRCATVLAATAAVTLGAAGLAGASGTGLDGLLLPDRPVGGPGAPSHRSAVVTVRAGESLWAIAADTLPASAGAARIDRAWRAWYAANRRTVGPDPDLLRPGQRLLPPAARERIQR